MIKSVLLTVLAMLLYSCQQTTGIIPQTPEQQTLDLDENNSQQVAWEELPDELKNAEPISGTSDRGTLGKTLASRYTYSIGPWGGTGGSAFGIQPPAGSTIYAMAIQAGWYVDRIVVWYKSANGTIYVGCDRGGNGGSYFLQYFSSDEYIRAIAGRTGWWMDRIEIYTNRKSFGYGGYGGVAFSASVPSSYQILGFFGRSGSLIDQIGCHVYTR